MARPHCSPTFGPTWQSATAGAEKCHIIHLGSYTQTVGIINCLSSCSLVEMGVESLCVCFIHILKIRLEVDRPNVVSSLQHNKCMA